MHFDDIRTPYLLTRHRKLSYGKPRLPGHADCRGYPSSIATRWGERGETSKSFPLNWLWSRQNLSNSKRGPPCNMPPARRLDAWALFPALRANHLSTHLPHFFIILCRVGHFKAATINWFAYIWWSTSVVEASAPGWAGKIHLVTVLNASIVVVLV